MDKFGIVDVVGEDVVGKVGGIVGGDYGVVERFKKDSFGMLPKISEFGTEEVDAEDTFGMLSVGAGREVAIVSSSSFRRMSSS